MAGARLLEGVADLAQLVLAPDQRAAKVPGAEARHATTYSARPGSKGRGNMRAMRMHGLAWGTLLLVGLSAVSLSTISLPYLACCAHAPEPAAAATPAPPARFARSAAPSRVEPTTAEACRACAGDWAQHGIASEPSCLCPTTDADKRCRDGAECQGQCLADAGEHEITAAGPPALGYFLGKCSRFRTTFGCHRYIAAGALKAGPVPLDDAPTEVCAD